MSALLQQVDVVIRQRGLFQPRERIVVAVSGGVDSMVLLRLLHELAGRKVHRWHLAVAHLNHGLRGQSSDADERLVRRVANNLELPIVVERADVRGFAQSRKLSLEMAARELRQAFLARTARQRKATAIALAHHADDQSELFFLRLFRGSGGEGLGGMKWRCPSPQDPGIDLVRPLLGQGKAALREYAALHDISFREDASNDSLEIQRNRIRHELLPLLRDHYQPGLDATLQRMMEIVGAEADAVANTAKEWLRGGRVSRKAPSFDQLPVAVQRRCLQLQLWELGVKPDFDLIEHLRLNPEIPICIEAPPGRAMRAKDGRVCLEAPAPAEFRTGALEVVLTGRSGTVEFAGCQVWWHRERTPGAVRPPAKPGLEFFDADRVGRRIVLRHWQPGDRFQPIGMKGAVKLQDLFVNQRVPRARRHELLLAATDTGKIFWVEGLRLGERFKLVKTTNRRLHWAWERL